MANVDAFNEGFDAGLGKKKAPKKKDPIKKDPMPGAAEPRTFKKGGKVKRTGVAKVHKGERVLTKGQAKQYAKKSGRKKVACKRK